MRDTYVPTGEARVQKTGFRLRTSICGKYQRGAAARRGPEPDVCAGEARARLAADFKVARLLPDPDRATIHSIDMAVWERVTRAPPARSRNRPLPRIGPATRGIRPSLLTAPEPIKASLAHRRKVADGSTGGPIDDAAKLLLDHNQKMRLGEGHEPVTPLQRSGITGANITGEIRMGGFCASKSEARATNCLRVCSGSIAPRGGDDGRGISRGE